MADNTQIVLVERPTGKLQESHFEIRQGPMPVPGDAQVLVRSILLSQDAANRAWMQGPTYRDAVNPGDVMHGYALCEVVESRSGDHQPGDLVMGEAGWQQYAALDAAGQTRLGLIHLEAAMRLEPDLQTARGDGSTAP